MYCVIRFAWLQNYAHSDDYSRGGVLVVGFVTRLCVGVLGEHGRVWILDGVGGVVERGGGGVGVLFGAVQRVGDEETGVVSGGFTGYIETIIIFFSMNDTVMIVGAHFMVNYK